MRLLPSRTSISPDRTLRTRTARDAVVVILLLVAAILVTTLGRAQTPGDAVLTKIKDVLALSDAAAAPATQRVKLRGVVIYVTASRDDYTVHDGEASISLMATPEIPAPDFKEEVEIEGTVVVETLFEKKQKRIKPAKITVLGIGGLPPSKPVKLDDVAQFRQLDQWVSVEGTVLQVRASMALFTIQMVDEGGSCNVLVRDWPRGSLPRDWIGGKVRVTGVNRSYMPGSRFLSLVAPSPEQVTVVSTGVVDPTDAPASSVEALKRTTGWKSARIKLTGTLVGATTGNVFYARCEDGSAFSFYMLHPIDDDKSGRYSTPINQPKCSPGDVIEVVGIPTRLEPGVHLNFGVVRVVRSGAVPAPMSTDIATIADGRHVHDLVELQGRLLSVDDVMVAPDRWRTTMKLQDGERSIIAFLDSSTRGVLTSLPHDSLLQVKGIVTGAPHFPEIRLWLRSPEDVQALGMAKEVENKRLWTGLGIAAIAVVMLAGWVLVLGRSRTAVKVANASLEARVAERTAELASAKEDLARALSQERELNELKTRFVSLVSHEFRTPLGVTMSAVEVLRHYRDQISAEKQIELHDDIFSATLQMSGLMDQVLLLGRAEAGKLEWRPVPIDLSELCGKLVDEGHSSTNHRCPVSFACEGQIDDACMDAALLRHIIGNLLSNAVKYSAEGSPVELRVKREGDEVVIAVQDHGIGIPEPDQARLFEAFHRASNVGETPGTGLGLMLVKRCVELHHGTITVQSKERVGTTFTVRLPLRASAGGRS